MVIDLQDQSTDSQETMETSMQRIIFILVAAMASGAHAQVVKCTNASTGKITYSDRQCDAGNSGSLIERRRSAESISAERQQAARANEEKYSRRRADDNARESAREEPDVAQQALPDKSKSYECKMAKQEYATVASSITGTEDDRRNRNNAAMAKVNADCGTSNEMAQAPPVVVFQKPRSIIFNNCNQAFCYDTAGNVYNRVSPNFMTGRDGVTCTGAGSAWTCQQGRR